MITSQRSERPGQRLLIATDAYRPQINGVALTLEWLAAELRACGVDTVLLSPKRFRSVPLPTYPHIRLAMPAPGAIADAIDTIAPDAIHIATEGPIGYLTRRYCLARKRPFTTCYHTRFPEYIAARAPVPLSVSYAALRRFHTRAAATLVATQSLKSELEQRGFTKLVLWKRGIPTNRFSGHDRTALEHLRPIFMSVGRIAVEKNIDAFLKLDLPGTKIVVGEGPARAALERLFPDVVFVGPKYGRDLAAHYAAADCFVFPSRTDTFGLVILEALAAGVPVAAFPVPGPLDILKDSGCGVLDDDLGRAAVAALSIPRERCRTFAQHHTIRESMHSFLACLREALGVTLPTYGDSNLWT